MMAATQRHDFALGVGYLSGESYERFDDGGDDAAFAETHYYYQQLRVLSRGLSPSRFRLLGYRCMAISSLRFWQTLATSRERWCRMGHDVEAHRRAPWARRCCHVTTASLHCDVAQEADGWDSRSWPATVTQSRSRKPFDWVGLLEESVTMAVVVAVVVLW